MSCLVYWVRSLDGLGAVLIRNLYLAEIVLRNFARESVEPDQRRDRPHSRCLRQRIHGTLAAAVPRQRCTMQRLDRPQRWVVGQRPHEHIPIRLGLRRATHLAPRPLGEVIDAGDVVFRRDSAGQLRTIFPSPLARITSKGAAR